jgi:hypothetical protein
MNTSTAFRVVGKVKQEKEFTLSALLDMDKVVIRDLPVACGSGEPKGRIDSCVGVLLTDIINDVEVITTEHNDTKKMYVVVASVDGYRTLFSWQELYNSRVGEGVVVILEKDGKKLYEQENRVDLFSANDFLTGPRYVKQLLTISILQLD